METTTAYWGNSLGFRIPRALQEISNITDRTRIRIDAEPNRLVITKIEESRKHIPLAERFKDYKGDYNGEVVDWGDDVGGEVCD